MTGELVPEGVALRFIEITDIVGGRAIGANLFIEEGSVGIGIGNGPWNAQQAYTIIHGQQATIVRDDQSGYTTGDDVTIRGPMIDLAIAANYHLEGMPADYRDLIMGRDTACPAAFSMLTQHELGHVTIHPAGDMQGYDKQAKSMPLPQTGGFADNTMNLLSDLVLNHSVFHSANILSRADPDQLLRMRRDALYGFATLYMMPQCQNYGVHAQMVEDGSLPDTRYVPTGPCTAESDPNLGPPVPCSVAAAGGTHDIGCYDEHYVNPNQPDDADDFMRMGRDSSLWQALTGHGRGGQFYPMLSSAVKYNLDASRRRVILRNSPPNIWNQPPPPPPTPANPNPPTPPGRLEPLPIDADPIYQMLDGGPLRVHNCSRCGNVWYPHDTAYTDLSMGAFVTADGGPPSAEMTERLGRYVAGEECPGRVPWKDTCGAPRNEITTWDFVVGTEMIVEGTRTFDDRGASDTALDGMEPIWVLEFPQGSAGLTRVSGSSSIARIDRSYFIQLCPDCGQSTDNYYGEGYQHGRSYLTEMLERVPMSHRTSPDKRTLNQLLCMAQWAGIYADMSASVEDPGLRLRNPNGNRFPLGERSASEWLALIGVSRARINRGC